MQNVTSIVCTCLSINHAGHVAPAMYVNMTTAELLPRFPATLHCCTELPSTCTTWHCSNSTPWSAGACTSMSPAIHESLLACLAWPRVSAQRSFATLVFNQEERTECNVLNTTSDLRSDLHKLPQNLSSTAKSPQLAAVQHPAQHPAAWLPLPYGPTVWKMSLLA
jgi:hypothetical protein